MYTDELLEEKARAQRALVEMAEKQGKDYLQYVEDEVRDLFQRNGWRLVFSQRKSSGEPSKPLR